MYTVIHVKMVILTCVSCAHITNAYIPFTYGTFAYVKVKLLPTLLEFPAKSIFFEIAQKKALFFS